MSALPQTSSPSPTRGVRDSARRGHRAPPPLRLVPPRPKASWVGVMVVLIITGVLLVVALQAQAATAAFDARALESEVVELQRRHEQLVAEVAQMQAPDRLRSIAINELGMIPAQDATYVDLRSSVEFANGEADRIVDPVKQARTDR